MKPSQYYVLALSSLSLVIFAVILQQVGYQGVSFLPCPLCVLQRVGYLGIALFCLLAANTVSLRMYFHVLALMTAIYGFSVAAHQVWLLSHPASSCGIDPLETWINRFQLAKSFPMLFKADGLCSAQLPAILGLQVPEWSLLWFGGFLVVLSLTLMKKPAPATPAKPLT
ncbi:disulfide bond formation protein B [Polynucleobacter meluiroseus]|nr:disulfide bond formation protein B [Polynucleobacter meluiroseus]